MLHEYRAMRNVTVTLDEETARWARVEAARRDMSVSALLRELLTEHMRTEEDYDDAMDRLLAREPVPLKDPCDEYPTREDVHDRASLRR